MTKTGNATATLTFEAGKATTITHNLTLQGTTGQPLLLRSSETGTQWKIDPQGTTVLDYLDVKDSDNISGTEIDAGNVTNKDSGNNTGWLLYKAPIVTTQAATAIGTTTATSNGNITSLGIPNPEAHGVCWSTTANPTLADTTTDRGPALTTGPFASNLAGLNAGTTYHYRAYATNALGTVYGGDVTFTTICAPSTGGNATDTSTNGTTANWSAVTGAQGYYLDVSTSSSFDSFVAGYENRSVGDVTSFTITGLDSGVTYYYRVRSVNEDGEYSAYSNTITVTTIEEFSLTVSSGSGSGEYEAGTVVDITAYPASEGMVFDKWSGSTDGIANIYKANTTLTMPSSDVSIIASYKTQAGAKYPLTVGSGTGDGEYEAGTIVTIAADLPEEGMIFDMWAGDTEVVDNSNNPNTFLVMPEESISLWAEYRAEPVEKFILGVLSGTGDGNYTAGSVVSISADVPDEDMIFDTWTGDVDWVEDINKPNTNIIMPADNIQIKAVYAAKPEQEFILDVQSGTGSGTYTAGQNISINADLPQDGMIFDHWGGNSTYLENINTAVTTVIMPSADIAIQAVYVDKPAELFVLNIENGTGEGEYEAGEIVDIAADLAEDGFTFDKWTGQTALIANPNLPNTTLTMPGSDVSLRATYKAVSATVKFNLTVDQGTGDGNYTAGRVVTIAADVKDGFVFDCWAGQTSNIANVNIPNTTITMPGNDVVVTARFKQESTALFTVTRGISTPNLEVAWNIAKPIVTLAKASDKEQTISLGLVPCAFADSSDSDEQVFELPAGRLLNLEAPEVEGYVFDHWEGQTSNVQNVLLPNTVLYVPFNDLNVRAVYVQQAADVDLDVQNGTGSGSYQPGEEVVIQADTAPDGQMFDKWTGQTGNMENINLESTTIVMPNVDVQIRATYQDIPAEEFVLTVDGGEGSGSRTAGSYVEIQSGDAPAGMTFDKWTGQIANVENINQSTTRIYMPANDATVIATFKEIPSRKLSAGGGCIMSTSRHYDWSLILLLVLLFARGRIVQAYRRK